MSIITSPSPYRLSIIFQGISVWSTTDGHDSSIHKYILFFTDTEITRIRWVKEQLKVVIILSFSTFVNKNLQFKRVNYDGWSQIDDCFSSSLCHLFYKSETQYISPKFLTNGFVTRGFWQGVFDYFIFLFFNQRDDWSTRLKFV